MARFRTEGLDDIIDDMAAMGESTGELADEMLFAGAEEIKKAWKAAIRMHKHIDTGAMLDSVDYSRKVKQIGDIKSVDIFRKAKIKGQKSEKPLIYIRYIKRGTHFVDDADDIMHRWLKIGLETFLIIG